MSMREFRPPPLGISAQEAQQQFDDLQRGLEDQWRLIGRVRLAGPSEISHPPREPDPS